MGCPGTRQAQDEWMVDFFGSSPTLELDGTDLAVRSDEAKVWFVPADEVASDEPGDAEDLVGTEWRLTHIEERDGDVVGMMVVPRRVTATIRFEDGEVTFDTGCNSGGGRRRHRGRHDPLRGVSQITLVALHRERPARSSDGVTAGAPGQEHGVLVDLRRPAAAGHA